MWLMTKHGFYSIVQKQPGEFHVRSRERKDIENLVAGVPLPGTKIAESSHNDYACRVVVGQPEVLSILGFLGESLDYDNFKNKIDRTLTRSTSRITKFGSAGTGVGSLRT